MRRFVIVLVFALVVFSAYGIAMAMHHTPEERGKALFSSTGFAGGVRSCNDCHRNGAGLAKSGARADFAHMGKTLADAVNYCIVNALKGKPLALDSDEMKDITSYIISLGAGK